MQDMYASSQDRHVIYKRKMRGDTSAHEKWNFEYQQIILN